MKIIYKEDLNDSSIKEFNPIASVLDFITASFSDEVTNLILDQIQGRGGVWHSQNICYGETNEGIKFSLVCRS